MRTEVPSKRVMSSSFLSQNLVLVTICYPMLLSVLRIHDILVRIRILLFSSLTFKMPTKKLHSHHLSKIKSQKEVTKSRNHVFSYYFCLMIEGSGSGSRKPKYIRIRIRNTGCNIIQFNKLRLSLHAHFWRWWHGYFWILPKSRPLLYTTGG